MKHVDPALTAQVGGRRTTRPSLGAAGQAGPGSAEQLRRRMG